MTPAESTIEPPRSRPPLEHHDVEKVAREAIMQQYLSTREGLTHVATGLLTRANGQSGALSGAIQEQLSLPEERQNAGDIAGALLSLPDRSRLEALHALMQSIKTAS